MYRYFLFLFLFSFTPSIRAEDISPLYLNQYEQLISWGKKNSSTSTIKKLNQAYDFLEETGKEEEVIELMNEVLLIEENDRAYFYRGRAYQDLNQESKALDDFNKAIALNPKFDFYFYARANAKSELNDKYGAIEDYKKSAELNSSNVNGLGNLAWELYKLNQNQEAIKTFDQALKIDNRHANNYRMRGIIKHDLKDFQGAIEDFNKALNIPSKIADEKALRIGVHEDAYYERGWAKFELEDYEGACKDWSRASKLGNTDATKRFNFSCLQKEDKTTKESLTDDVSQIASLKENAFKEIDAGNYENALSDLSKIIELDQYDDQSYFLRGALLLELDESQLAIKALEKAIELDPNKADYHYYLAKAILKNEPDQNTIANRPDKENPLIKSRKQAIESFDKAISINPSDVSYFEERAFTKFLIKDFDGSNKDYSEAIKIDPSNYQNYFRRGVTYLSSNQSNKACKDLEKAKSAGIKKARDLFNEECKESTSSIGSESFIIYWGRGVEKEKSGDNEGAIEDFTKAIEIEPDNKYAYNSRALTKSKIGDKKGAIEDYTKGLEIDPLDPLMYRNRGSNKLDIEDYDGAVVDFDKALELTPNDAVAYFMRGWAKGLLGDMNSACEDLSNASDLDLKDADAVLKEFCE